MRTTKTKTKSGKLAEKRQKIKIKKQKKVTKIELLLYLLLALTILAYAATRSAIFSVIFVIEFVILLVDETRRDIKTQGVKKTLKETLEAVAIVLIVWLAAIVILGNATPIDVVPSCSMLPKLRIGDLVILDRISNMSSFLAYHHVPVVNVSPEAYSAMLKHISNEYLAFYAYLGNNESKITYLLSPGEHYSIGLYNTKCLSYYSYTNQENEFYKCKVSNSTQDENLIKYSYGIGNAIVNNEQYLVVYTKSITIANTTITENYSNPIIVYSTLPNDTFTGNIVHRIFAAIRVGNEYYMLTKGDNNPALDLEFGNYPASQKQVVGTVIAKIPWLGYITLAFKGGIDTAGCNQVILHSS
ncbi:MAG: hypothetical protein ACP5TJ_02500 [Candidatus Micrarchaeia archaeon]